MKIAVLSSYTIDLVVNKADELLGNAQIKAEWYVGPFGQWRQELLSNDSKLKTFDPDILLLYLDDAEILANPDEVLSLLKASTDARPSCSHLVANCVPLFRSTLSMLEWNTRGSRRYRAASFNCRLSDLACELANLKVLDLQQLIEQCGRESMVDARFFYMAKMPFSTDGIEKVAGQLATAIKAIAGKRAKCIVVDLDGTLWGGIIGEDGIDRIRLGFDGESKAWLDLQKHLLELHTSGILLAICSKNDEEQALAAIDQHPHMLLRRSHFSAWRINWLDKVTNIRSLANELNIGLDSLILLEDSAHERELVRALLPEVRVPDMPADPSNFAEFVCTLPDVETFFLSDEDLRRNDLYQQERNRKEAGLLYTSLEDFLASLKIEVKLEDASSFNIPRMAQLVEKTNQFNLTNRRYSEKELKSFAASADWSLLGLSVSDRLGDSGLVGVAILERKGKAARLDTFLLSCRVLGRGIEQAFMAAIRQRAKSQGFQIMTADYIPSGKNSVAKDFLPQCKFAPDNGYLSADLNASFKPPTWITIAHGE
jgi:FkbH-like protein